jgi:hypothetical protein
MKGGREKFGAFIRREREAKEIGLREMAKKIGVSPTCLSKVERDEFPPPAEDKVREIAGGQPPWAPRVEQKARRPNRQEHVSHHVPRAPSRSFGAPLRKSGKCGS